jgi:transcriptional regulator with XRE-family HTH domain
MNDTDPRPASKLLDLLKAENEALLREGKALADLVGMSQSHLDKILSGEKTAGAQSLKKIATYFTRSRENPAEASATAAAGETAAQSSLASSGNSTIRVLELGAVEQRQYIAAMLEASGIPKGIASYVGLHVELDGTLSPAGGMRAAQALANTMLEEEAAEDNPSSPED